MGTSSTGEEGAEFLLGESNMPPVAADLRQDTSAPNTPMDGNTGNMMHRHSNQLHAHVKFVSSDGELQNFRRVRTNWTNFVSCSKYYEDQLDHDFLDDVNQTIHLWLTARRGLKLEEMASCRFRVHLSASDEDPTPVSANECVGHSFVNSGQLDDVYLNPDFLTLEGDRSNDAVGEILESLFNSLANTLQHLHVERDAMQPLSNVTPNYHQKNSTYAEWSVEEELNAGALTPAEESVIGDILKSQESRSRWSSQDSTKRVLSSSHQFSHSRQNYAQCEAQTSSLQLARLTIPSRNITPQKVFTESSAPCCTDKECTTGMEEVNLEESAIVQAIIVFMDIFEDALESPDVPLMQLDADSLVMNELADALNKSCEQSVKVVDLFSSGKNTCAGLLRFISSGVRDIKSTK